VTLARLRREASAKSVARYLGECGLFAPLNYTVERVVLYSARESRGGGPYVVEAAYPLG
jgi:2'-5' RNA ligase